MSQKPPDRYAEYRAFDDGGSVTTVYLFEQLMKQCTHLIRKNTSGEGFTIEFCRNNEVEPVFTLAGEVAVAFWEWCWPEKKNA